MNYWKAIIFLLAGVFPAGASALTITEIMYDAEGSDAGREWVEVYNESEAPVMITGGSGADAFRFFDTSFHTVSLIRGSDIIQPHETFIIAADATQFIADRPNILGAVFDTSMSLTNASGTVAIYPTRNDPPLHTVAYESSMGGSGNGRTLERDLETGALREGPIGGTPGVYPPPAGNADSSGAPDDSTDIPDDTDPVDPDTSEDSAPETSVDIPPAESQSGPVIDWSYDFHISEIMPNPYGDDGSEWIELANDSPFSINVSGWELRDASGKGYVIFEKDGPVEIVARGFLVLPRSRTKIALNNDKDDVHLFTPEKSHREVVSYSGAREGIAFARGTSGYAWTDTPTPGAGNMIVSPEETEKDSGAEDGSEEVTDSAPTDVNEIAVPTSTPAIAEAFLPGEISITEVVPNPDGPDTNEWLELKNATTTSRNLVGLILSDQSGKPIYTFPTGFSLVASEYRVIPKSDFIFSLNNTSDTVRLAHPDGTEIASVSYETAKSGFSYAYDETNEEWTWTAAQTPGASYAPEEDPSILGEQILAASSAYDVAEAPLESRVSLRGVLIAPPGSVLKRSFFLGVLDGEAYDPEGLVEAYKSDGIFPTLVFGDVVVMTGTIKEYRGSRRIAIGKDDVLAVEGTVSVAPYDMQVADISGSELPAWVTVSGSITSITAASFAVESGGDSVRVYPAAGIEVASLNFSKGDYVRVSGMARKRGSGVAVTLLASDHVMRVAPPEETSVESGVAEETIISADTKKETAPYLYMSTIPLAALLGFLFKKLLPKIVG